MVLRNAVLLLCACGALSWAGDTVVTQQGEVIVTPRTSAASTNLLFAFVSSQAGFDTEITIANTSKDPFGTTATAGTCTVYYFGATTGGGAPPAPQTSGTVAAGSTLDFTFSSGGGGLLATPGFQGYIITECSFSLARGRAKVSLGGHLAMSQDAQAISAPRSTTKPQNLLFPFVTNQDGFDTGIAISNTSDDPFGSAETSGTCTFNYYGSTTGGGGAPPPQTSGTVAAGSTMVFTLSSGGTSVAATPGFQGYIIAQCNFTDAASFAFVSDVGAQKLAMSETGELITAARGYTNALLFSSVSNQNGADTQIAIANTSEDPFGTTQNSGPCYIDYYGSTPGGGPPAAQTSSTVAAGSTLVFTLSSGGGGLAATPGFQGYLIASCSFPLARGWAFTAPIGDASDGDSQTAELVVTPRSTTRTPLLFSDTGNWEGTDTQITISNTSQDPFGTTQSSGSCTISYYGQVGNGGSSPASQVSSVIQPGAQLSFTLSGGNSAQNIAATPGFHGYVIANCGFPLARGQSTTTAYPTGMVAASATPGIASFNIDCNACEPAQHYTQATAFPVAYAPEGVYTITYTLAAGYHIVPGADQPNPQTLTASGDGGTGNIGWVLQATQTEFLQRAFVQQGSKLVGTGAAGTYGAYQGGSVALSADGNTAIVGGDYDNDGVGAAWVFTRSGGVWTQQGSKLVGTGAVNGEYGAGQGGSVALSADGNTAVVGGHYDNNGVGAAWVYTRSGSVWTQQGSKLVPSNGGGYFGQSVALSADGNTALVGGIAGSGAAWVFTRSGSLWTQQGSELVGTGAVGEAEQGTSVALSADGNTALVGGRYDNNGIGATWVYTRSGGAWTQQGSKLVGTGGIGAEQGGSVALSADGDTAFVGGFDDNDGAGAAWVFTRSGGVWTQDGNKLFGIGGVGSAYQGGSVALSSDGRTAIVGGYSDNDYAGAVWVYTRSGGAWTQDGVKLVGTGAVGSACQGIAVALSADGNTAIVGGSCDSDAGATWIFTSSSPPAKVGTYNAGQWYLDVNGNGTWNGDPPDLSANFGWAGATSITGDWNGDGRKKMGIFYNGYWYLDYDGNGIWDGGVIDKQYVFGWADPSVIPVVGDWNGDGRTKIGVYYQGFWYLDYDGNGVWDGGVNDKAYNFGWPAAGVTPMVGDWSGTGTAKIGIYYYGFWYLDYDGNGVWDGGVNDKAYDFGWPATGVTPIMGDWNADGRAKIGIYYQGFWYLDYDGNGVWDGGVNDKMYNLGWSDPSVKPVTGDWTGTGTSKIGIYTNGSWFLDFIGNGVWDGGTVDKAYVWGQAGDTPLVGAW